jgi:hypothetical protein
MTTNRAPDSVSGLEFTHYLVFLEGFLSSFLCCEYPSDHLISQAQLDCQSSLMQLYVCCYCPEVCAESTLGCVTGRNEVRRPSTTVDEQASYQGNRAPMSFFATTETGVLVNRYTISPFSGVHD